MLTKLFVCGFTSIFPPSECPSDDGAMLRTKPSAILYTTGVGRDMKICKDSKCEEFHPNTYKDYWIPEKDNNDELYTTNP